MEKEHPAAKGLPIQTRVDARWTSGTGRANKPNSGTWFMSASVLVLAPPSPRVRGVGVPEVRLRTWLWEGVGERVLGK